MNQSRARGGRVAIAVLGLLAAVWLLASVLAQPASAATAEGAVVSNGTVQLGVNSRGALNYDCEGFADPICPPNSVGGQSVVGIRYQPENLEAISPGCFCEGWGVADATTLTDPTDPENSFYGDANVAEGDDNITVESFAAPTGDNATSTVAVANAAFPGRALRVVHDYRPSPLSPNLFLVTVTITNTGSVAIGDLRYRRAMDWDVEPTAFDEWVTIQGGTPQLLFDSDDGFADTNPLAPKSYIETEAVCGADYQGPCLFTDLGSGGVYPTATSGSDHGALFDFGFGSLAPGASRTFTIYYGAASNETEALNALNAGSAELYSLGESNCEGATISDCTSAPAGTDSGPRLGEPATFMFAFVTAAADVAITKQDKPDPAKINRPLTYTLNVKNNGPDPARGVTVTDTLPDGVRYVSGSSPRGACTRSDKTVTCPIGTVAVGATVTVKINVKPTKSGTITNRASVSTLSGDSNPANNNAQARTKVQKKAPKCLIRTARARVFVFRKLPIYRLVVRYRTARAAQVRVIFKAKMKNGQTVRLGGVKVKFSRQGLFRLPKRDPALIGDLRRKVKFFTVNFKIPGTGKACARAYFKKLTKKRIVERQFVWFQSDATF